MKRLLPRFQTSIFFVSILLTTGLVACDEGGGKTENKDPSAGGSADKDKSGATQAVNASDVSAEKGKELYTINCSACHGLEGEGRIGMGPRLASKSFLEAASDEMLQTTIAKGRGGTTMIAWGSVLSPTDVASVVAHLRGMVEHTPAKLDESPNQGDAAAGEKVFLSICAACHGRNGAGYSEASSGTGIARKPFLDSVSNGYLRYIIKKGKAQTKMGSFQSDSPTAVANLSDDEIENVIAYLRGAAW